MDFFKKFGAFKNKAKEVISGINKPESTPNSSINKLLIQNFPSINYQIKTLDKQKMILGYFEQAFKNQEIFSKITKNYFELNISSIVSYLGPELAPERELLLETSRQSESSLNRAEILRSRHMKIFSEFDETRRLIKNFEDKVVSLLDEYRISVRENRDFPDFTISAFNNAYQNENIAKFDYLNNQFEYILQFSHKVQRYLAKGISEGINVVFNLGLETNKNYVNLESVKKSLPEDNFNNLNNIFDMDSPKNSSQSLNSENSQNTENTENTKSAENPEKEEKVEEKTKTDLDQLFTRKRVSSYSFLHPEEAHKNEQQTLNSDDSSTTKDSETEKEEEKNINTNEMFNMFVVDHKKEEIKKISKALEEKEKKIFEEKNEIDKKIEEWKVGETGNDKDIYQLLNTLDEILWEGCKVPKFGILELSQSPSSLKKCYYKAMLKIHPDKVTHLDEKTQYLAKELTGLLSLANAKKINSFNK